MSRLSVATLNLRNRKDRWLERRSLIVGELVDHTPDIVSLQEINLPLGQGRWLRNQINNRLTGSSKGPYRLIQARRKHFLRGYFEGIGILSKRTVLSHDTLNLGYGGRVALRANLELSATEPLDFISVHLHNVAGHKEAREDQVRRIIAWLNDRGAVSMQVIAGDFNEVPDGPAVVHIKQLYRSAFEAVRGSELLATFPTLLGGKYGSWAGCLDYIFISKNSGTVVEAQLICNKPAVHDRTLYPSDHVGLLATIEF